MTINLPIDQIDSVQLEILKSEGVREGRQLEYKEKLPGTSDDDKREFLSDVTSFANAAGGDLIFGVQERREVGKPTAQIETIVGIADFNLDAVRLRLESMVLDGVAPRIAPISFHEICRNPDPPCLLLRVPRSWTGLHMVTYKNYSRFFSRTSGGKYQLDVHEIRAGFIAAETAFERLRRFRIERVARVLALETPIAIGDGPKLIFHALPVGGLDEVWARVLTIEAHNIAFSIAAMRVTPETWRFNLDGFVFGTINSDLSRQSYTQLFRDGGIEVVSRGLLTKDEKRGGFWAWGMEQQVIAALQQYQTFWRDLGVTPPLVISLTLSGVSGWKGLRDAYGHFDQDVGFDRDVVSSPEVMLSDIPSPSDVVLRPLFDYVWNGGGWPGSPNYKDGRWFPPS